MSERGRWECARCGATADGDPGGFVWARQWGYEAIDDWRLWCSDCDRAVHVLRVLGERCDDFGCYHEHPAPSPGVVLVGGCGLECWVLCTRHWVASGGGVVVMGERACSRCGALSSDRVGATINVRSDCGRVRWDEEEVWCPSCARAWRVQCALKGPHLCWCVDASRVAGSYFMVCNAHARNVPYAESRPVGAKPGGRFSGLVAIDRA